MLEYQTYILTLKQQQKEAELRQVQQAAIKAKIKVWTETISRLTAKVNFEKVILLWELYWTFSLIYCNIKKAYMQIERKRGLQAK